MTVPAWVRTAALLLVTFAAGAMAGIGYERHIRVRHASTSIDARVMMHHLETELQLDSGQRAQVETILARHQIAIDSSWRIIQPHVRATLDSAHQEILGVLRPDQAERFRGAMTEMHRTMMR